MYQNIHDVIKIIDKIMAVLTTITTLITIVNLMFCIYLLTLVGALPYMSTFTNSIGFSSVSCGLQLIITCFMCGLVGDKCVDIMDTLNGMNTRDMTDREYREWHTFATVMRNTRTFGFTIGGFAALNKSTLISVQIFIFIHKN